MLRVLLVDDEPLARLRLRQLVGACTEPPASVVGECGDAVETRDWLQQHPAGCDLVLLDVQMPGDDGTVLAAALADAARLGGGAAPWVVFVTAHAEHALRAFELGALDYLTKPVRQERLQAALARAAARQGSANAAAGTAEAPPQAAEVPALVVSDRGRLTRVSLGEVLYFKAELKYVTLRTAQHTHVIDETLNELEARFGERFLRIHRNALVARRALRRLERRPITADCEDDAGEGWAVALDGLADEWLLVSRRQLAAVREALLEMHRDGSR